MRLQEFIYKSIIIILSLLYFSLKKQKKKQEYKEKIITYINHENLNFANYLTDVI